MGHVCLVFFMESMHINGMRQQGMQLKRKIIFFLYFASFFRAIFLKKCFNFLEYFLTIRFFRNSSKILPNSSKFFQNSSEILPKSWFFCALGSSFFSSLFKPRTKFHEAWTKLNKLRIRHTQKGTLRWQETSPC